MYNWSKSPLFISIIALSDNDRRAAVIAAILVSSMPCGSAEAIGRPSADTIAADFTSGIYQFSVFHVLYILLFILLVYLVIKHKEVFHIKLRRNNIKKVFHFSLMLFFLMNCNAVYPVKTARLHTSDHYLYYSNFDSNAFASKFSLLNLLTRDFGGALIPSFGDSRKVEYIDEYFETHTKEHLDNEYTGIFEGKNLIFIVGESYDEIALSEELTPNIFKLKTEGLDFVNHYTPVYPRTTCDTEIFFNTGLIPSISNGPTCYVYNQNSYTNSLPELFNNRDYETKALHSNDSDFYTRDIVYEGFGYDEFLGREDLDLSLTDMRYDSVFESKAIDEMVSVDNSFFSFVITLSGHSPYSMENLAVEKNIQLVENHYGDSIPSSIKNFIATQLEIDIFVGNLLADLETRNILDDTVIIIFQTVNLPGANISCFFVVCNNGFCPGAPR